MNYVDMFLFELNLMYDNVCVEYVFYLLEIANTKKYPFVFYYYKRFAP